MKVLMINGSSHENGCKYTALKEISDTLLKEEIESEIVWIGNKTVRDCIACGACAKLENQCTFSDDLVNEVLEKAKTADGFIFGTPVYYAHPSGRLLSFMDRMFYSANKSYLSFKPAAAIASARRAGTTASLDVINKHFTITNMPVVSSNYWNMVHGNTPEEVKKDEEGLQIMRHLALNMSWLLKCIDAGKKQGISNPNLEEKIKTNFIR